MVQDAPTKPDGHRLIDHAPILSAGDFFLTPVTLVCAWDGEPFPCGYIKGIAADPYVQEADANPERRDNGCMIYRQGDA